MKIFVLIALAQYEANILRAFGVKALALSVVPPREMRDFGPAGVYEAYFIQVEQVLNITIQSAMWTPVAQWWTLEFDAPEPYPVVMYASAAPVENGVRPEPSIVRPEPMDAPDAPQNGSRFDWTPARKKVLAVMVKHAEASLEMSLGDLSKEAGGVGKSTVSAVKEMVEKDRRLLNGMGKEILKGQS